MSVTVRPAAPADAALVFELIGELAAYERLAHEAAATPDMIAQALFVPSPRVFRDLAAGGPTEEMLAAWFRLHLAALPAK